MYPSLGLPQGLHLTYLYLSVNPRSSALVQCVCRSRGGHCEQRMAGVFVDVDSKDNREAKDEGDLGIGI